MALKKYIALADGYVDGKVRKAGEAFETDFREVVREKPTEREGKPNLPGAIKRDKKGEVVTKDAAAPTWVRLADEAEYLASLAADGQVDDPNFEEMDDAALQAYAAERGVPFTAKTKRDDLITGIKAAYDATR